MIHGLRLICAFLAAMLLAFLLVIAVEFYSSLVHPFPPGLGMTPEEICLHVTRYPQWVLATVVPLWGGTAWLGTWVAHRLGSWGCGLAVAMLLYAAVLFNCSMLPYPLWFKGAMTLAIPVAAYAALRGRAGATAVNDTTQVV